MTLLALLLNLTDTPRVPDVTETSWARMIGGCIMSGLLGRISVGASLMLVGFAAFAEGQQQQVECPQQPVCPPGSVSPGGTYIPPAIVNPLPQPAPSQPISPAPFPSHPVPANPVPPVAPSNPITPAPGFPPSQPTPQPVAPQPVVPPAPGFNPQPIAPAPAPVAPAPAPFRPAPARPQGGGGQSLGRTADAGGGGESLAPNMIGDFFGPPSAPFIGDLLGGFSGDFDVPSSAQASVGRQKIAENTSPLPRDRVFANFSFFSNTQIATNDINVSRITSGIEKTFFDGDASIEFRAPFAETLAADSVFDDEATDFQLGDLTIYLKTLLYATNNTQVGGGLGLTVPTADDLSQEGEVFLIEHEAYHLLPYLAYVRAQGNTFIQLYGQLDIDLNGDSITTAAGTGRTQDPTLLHLSLATGVWMYRCPRGLIRGIAPTAEVHYNRALDGTDEVTIAGLPQFVSLNRFENFNAVLGATTLLGDASSFTLGYGFPLGNSSDKNYDGEIRAVFNYYFGKGGNGSKSFGRAGGRRFTSI